MACSHCTPCFSYLICLAGTELEYDGDHISLFSRICALHSPASKSRTTFSCHEHNASHLQRHCDRQLIQPRLITGSMIRIIGASTIILVSMRMRKRAWHGGHFRGLCGLYEEANYKLTSYIGRVVVQGKSKQATVRSRIAARKWQTQTAVLYIDSGVSAREESRTNFCCVPVLILGVQEREQTAVHWTAY